MENEYNRDIVVAAYMDEISKLTGRMKELEFMGLFQRIKSRKAKISLIGLGYVGLPIAVAFAKKVEVIGFDINKDKVDLYKKGVDPTTEVGNQAIANCTAEFTSDETRLQEALFHIVAVPTPVNAHKLPDLSYLESASSILGRNLKKGSIVVYESTVYPGLTEDICVPILERASGLKCGLDFKIGYSPERINPGDKLHRLETIVKIVSGIDQETLDTIADVYELVVEAGVYKAPSIRVAEAAKVIENSQRDINVAFMNELAIIFNKMGIDTRDVLQAAGTKWNFLPFTPGLVGGHCIGVDPYYLTYKAEEIGYHSQIILAGRKINDNMGKYIAESTVKKMIKANKQINRSNVTIFGITFKENCPDIRNTKVIDIIRELKEYGVQVYVVDPVADKESLWAEYQISLSDISDIKDIDAIIFTVPHDEFKHIGWDSMESMYKKVGKVCLEATDKASSNHILIDVKGMLDRKEAEDRGYLYWRL
jgi:UDP-N-acetyl-D-galactosamine dehydrogenase